jgi:hypothetical protein
MDNHLKPPEAPELQALQHYLTQARETIRKSQLQIVALENLVGAGFDQAQEALVVCDHHNRIIRASQAAH